MKIRILVAVFLITLSLGCKEDQTEDLPFTLIFGEAYGFCAGDCAHFFKMSGDNLFIDNIDRYSGSEPEFNGPALPQIKYDLAKPLVADFPEYLLNHPNETFGCPDCADQGGIHLYYNNGGESLFWHIDTNIDNQPIEIRTYVQQVRNAIDQLLD